MLGTQVNVMGTLGILMVDRACRDNFFTAFPSAGPMLTVWRLRPKPGNEATRMDPRVLAADALCTALQRDEDIRRRFALHGGLSGLAQMQIRSDIASVRVAAVSALATYMSSADGIAILAASGDTGELVDALRDAISFSILRLSLDRQVHVTATERQMCPGLLSISAYSLWGSMCGEVAAHVEASEARQAEINKLRLAARAQIARFTKPLPPPPPPCADGADAPDGDPVISRDRIDEIAGFLAAILAELPRADEAGGSLAGALLTLARDPRHAELVVDVLAHTNLHRQALGAWRLDATHGGGHIRTMMAAIVGSLAEWRTPPVEGPADAHSRGAGGGARDLRGPYLFRLLPLVPALLESALHAPSPKLFPAEYLNGTTRTLPDKHTPESYAAKLASLAERELELLQESVGAAVMFLATPGNLRSSGEILMTLRLLDQAIPKP